MSKERGRAPSTRREAASCIEVVCQELCALRLPLYQARVLAALLQLGTANSIQLAKVAGIPRTSTYQVMRALEAQGMLERVAAPGPASWTCQGAETVVQALEVAGQERMRQYEDQLRRLRQILAAMPASESRGSSVLQQPMGGAASDAVGEPPVACALHVVGKGQEEAC